MTEISPRVLKNLKCFACNKYLSFAPVFMLFDGYGICGRCKLEPDSGQIPALTYEKFARKFAFPCKNNCGQTIAWDDVRQHEKRCSRRCGFCCCVGGCSCPCRKKKKKDITMITLDEPDLDLLKCTSCSRYLTHPAMYISTTGRNLCDKCGPQQVGAVRNIVLEPLMAHFVVKCRFRKKGCTEFGRFGDMLAYHEEICPYNENIRRRRADAEVVALALNQSETQVELVQQLRDIVNYQSQDDVSAEVNVVECSSAVLDEEREGVPVDTEVNKNEVSIQIEPAHDSNNNATNKAEISSDSETKEVDVDAITIDVNQGEIDEISNNVTFSETAVMLAKLDNDRVNDNTDEGTKSKIEKRDSFHGSSDSETTRGSVRNEGIITHFSRNSSARASIVIDFEEEF